MRVVSVGTGRYYDADPFLFYIMCEVDAAGCHIVGYARHCAHR